MLSSRFCLLFTMFALKVASACPEDVPTPCNCDQQTESCRSVTINALGCPVTIQGCGQCPFTNSNICQYTYCSPDTICEKTISSIGEYSCPYFEAKCCRISNPCENHNCKKKEYCVNVFDKIEKGCTVYKRKCIKTE